MSPDKGLFYSPSVSRTRAQRLHSVTGHHLCSLLRADVCLLVKVGVSFKKNGNSFHLRGT